jgi:FixJ family two-component response regulator
MNTPTVFVIDDDASVRRALGRLFQAVGIAVELFGSAADFLARSPTREHGCILLDIRMPDITGLELQRRLAEARIELPVIFLSAYADVALTVRAMKDGAIDLLTKPFPEQRLLDAIRLAFELDARRLHERSETERLQERFSSLTAREREVMGLVVNGRLNKQVAGLIGTSMKTVKAHRARVMAKMQASSLPELVRMADRLGLPRERPASEGVPKVQ